MENAKSFLACAIFASPSGMRRQSTENQMKAAPSFFAEFGWLPDAGTPVKVPGPETRWTQKGSGALGIGAPVVLTWDNGEGMTFERTISVDDRYMFEIADKVTALVDGEQWREDDLLTLEKIGETDTPVVLVINKADTIKDKGSILPLIETYHENFEFADIVPVSALKNQNLERLEQVIRSHLPQGAPIYDTEQITDRSERFLASEIIREKIMRQSGDEVPYDLTVQIDEFKDEPAHIDPKTGRKRKAVTFIDATIFVERNGQKAIIIGDKGSRIKQIGMAAREDMEALFERKIMLNLWVKVKQGWSDDARALTSLGY